jgi:transcriptional regulator with GAF, ATPase, and Fis domain
MECPHGPFPSMSNVTSATIPAHTVLGTRAQTERLGFQEFHLVLINTDGAGKSFPITDTTLKIGKSPDNDVVIDSPTVSRNHLVIRRQGDRFLVEDLQSTNGSFIDGAQIREAYLKPGQLLELGDVQLRFQSTLTPVKIAPSVEDRLGELVGKSVPMRQIFALLKRISSTDSTLLLVGETGSGKGAAAKVIHQLSPRHDGPLVVFDCAAVSDSLIESELFGHEKGAFTGAVNQRVGCLERAHNGTLFLDEIDDLALDLQPKLLRAIEDREFRRLGASSSPVAFDARIVAASKKDLWAETQAGRFREDLYFRLSVFTVSLPPLRDRKEDIPLLVDAFAAEPLFERLPAPVREQFLAHAWPGNVRELRNALERARHMVDIPELSSGSLLREFARDVPAAGGDFLPASYSGPFKECKEDLVRQFEREYLTRLLGRAKGNVAKAAREAELDRKHLYSLLHKYGLVQSDAE